MEYIKENLIEFGLSELESEIYLILLRSPQLTASQIAEKTHKTRTNIYPPLKALIAHNLVEELPKKRGFALTHPTNLRNLIASEQLRIQQLSLTLESSLPTLIREQGNTAGTMTTYSIKDGWDVVLHHIFQSKSKTVTHLRGLLLPPEELMKLPRELSRRDITFNAITPVTKAHQIAYSGSDSVYKTIHFFLDAEISSSLPDLLLTDSVVCIFQLTSITTCDNQAVVKSYQQLVESLSNGSASSQKALERRWRRL